MGSKLNRLLRKEVVKELKVTISKKSNGILEANKEKIESGYENENYAYTLEFEFPDFLSDYNKVIEFELNGNKVYGALLNDTYELKNNITQYSFVPCQVTFTKAIDEEHTQIYKTNKFYLEFGESINADLGIDPESEEVNVLNTLLESVNLALKEVSDLNNEVTQLTEETRLKGKYAQNQGDYAKEQGTYANNEGVYANEQGTRAKNIADEVESKLENGDFEAKINGYNTIEIVEGDNIVLTQSGNELTISALDYGARDYELLGNKPQINSVELVGNKSLVELGIQPVGDYALSSDIDEISDEIDNIKDTYSLVTETGSRVDLEINSSTFVLVAKLYDKNGNLLNTSRNIDLPLETMVVGAEYDSSKKEVVLTLQNGTKVRFSVADLVSGLQSEITSSNMLSSDLVDDTDHAHKFVSNAEKDTWNAKYEKLVTGIPKSDLSSSVQSSLDLADSSIQSSDLADYVKNTDYPSTIKNGVIRVNDSHGTNVNANGLIISTQMTYAQYQERSGALFVGKTTLENVITGKELVNKTYVDTIVGDIGTLLDNVNKEVI